MSNELHTTETLNNILEGGCHANAFLVRVILHHIANVISVFCIVQIHCFQIAIHIFIDINVLM
jgi:hypothetical protein